MNTRDMLISAAIAGALAGLLSILPVVSVVNCVLCAWLWLGGIFAVWLYRYLSGENLSTGQSALLGLLTGLIAGLFVTILQAIFQSQSTPIPPETMGQLDQMFGPEAARILTSPSTSVLFSLVFNVIFDTLFGTLGGLLGGAIFKPKPGAV